MHDESTATRREAPRARRRLGAAWVVFPLAIAVVVALVVLLGLLL